MTVFGDTALRDVIKVKDIRMGSSSDRVDDLIRVRRVLARFLLACKEGHVSTQ